MGQRQKAFVGKESELSLEDQIESYLSEQVGKAQNRNPFRGSTVGLEQEFFVFKADGKTPADLSDTQALLKTLSSREGWLKIDSKDRPITSVLTRVSYQHENARYTAIKYEFPPHLLEIAFTYYDNIQDLNCDIEDRWKDLQATADACNLKIALKPFIDPPALNFEDQISVDPKLPALAESRRVYFKTRGEEVDAHTVDFPSFVAATQTQVGIPLAWGNDKFMHRLYALELSILPLLNRTPQALGQRQKYYDSVFRGLKLLGVPDLKRWTLQDWIQAICDSPLISNLKSGNDTLRSMWESGKNRDLAALMARVRDLQIIRPKAIGTVEFRGDASVSDPSEMIRVVAIRFAAALLAADAEFSIPNEDKSLGKIRSEWNERIQSQDWTASQIQEAEQLFLAMREVLENRGRSEEKFLHRL